MKNDLFVLDTNVLLSALLDNSSKPAKAVLKARANGILLVSDEVATEYVQVFSRTKFERYVPLSYRLAFIENIISNALPVIISSPIVACRDPRDDKFLSLAVSGNATCVVSGDSDLLTLHPFQDIPIIKPIDFIDHFELA